MTEADAAAVLERELRDLIRVRGIDPAIQGIEPVRALLDEVLTEYDRRAGSSSLLQVSDREAIAKEVVDRVAGLGPLQELIEDPDVEEIWINGPGKVFCARGGRHTLTNIFISGAEIRDLVERMLRSSGRRLDLSSPFVDATLNDGSRLHVSIPDITRRHWAVNIRKFVLRAHRLDELVRLGSLSEAAARFLEASVEAGSNVVVSGATQSGKTTMLNCLAASIPPRERVITCEEVFELQIQMPDVVSMQTRQASMEGSGAIDLRRLIIEALRMRPDRLIVGEVRQQEALDLLVALNSGLPGMTSIHANSAAEALTKLTTLPLLAGENVTHAFVLPTVAASVDFIVHLSNRKGERRTDHIIAVTGRVEGTAIETAPLFTRTGTELQWTGHFPPGTEKFVAAGIDLQEVLGR